MGKYFFSCEVCWTRHHVGDNPFAKRPKGWRQVVNGPEIKLLCPECDIPAGFKLRYT